jgi:cell division transport system permease protein
MKSIIRNRLMSVASIVTVACCIFILAFSYCIIVNIDYILENVEEDMTLSVYVHEDVADEQLKDIEQKIMAIEHVVGTTYISSEQAMEEFGAEFTENEDFLAGLTEENSEEILPRSFDISVDDIVYQDQVRDELEKMVGTEFEEVRYNQEGIDVLIGINNIIRVVSVLIILFLSTVSVIIIMNTIKLTVTNRQNEINIMKYVGATDWFIRWPFIIEGVLIGFFGAVIPILVCMVSYGRVILFVEEKIPAITALFEFRTTQSVFVILAPFAIILGVAIGSIGSVTSIRKHLDV